MANKKHIKTKPSKPQVWGIGLTALDVILEQGCSQSQISAGGTCANVMCILTFFGWNAAPIARIANDSASQALVSDLRRWGVKTKFLHLRPQAKTPIIVEKIKKDSAGVPFHTFSFNCPACGGRLPQFQPVVSAAVVPLIKQTETMDVFFVDRVSRSALILAEAAVKAGAVVFFEPSASSGPKQLAEMLQLAHIVKYSHDRVKDTGELDWGSNTNLQIQTFGRGGLQFRTNLDGRHRNVWRSLPALPVSNLRDAAGAGDWLSAVLINRLCYAGAKHFRNATFEQVLQSLNFGQALAAWNCRYPGPRGSMYALSPTQFWSQVKQLQRGKEVRPVDETAQIPELFESPRSVCSLCRPKRMSTGRTFAA